MDQVLRAITRDGAFRVVAVQTTQSTRGVIQAQRATGDSARLLAELVTGAILIRETMAPDLRVQGILQGHDPKTRIVADAYPDGSTRGLIQSPKGHVPSLGDKAILQMMRTLHNGDIAQGVVQANAKSGISGALMEYMQASEQVVSFCAVGANDDASGGYIVQLLPEVGEGPLMVMTERLDDFPPIGDLLARGDASPEKLVEEILYGMPYEEVGRRTLRFECKCTDERVLLSIASLPKDDILDLIRANEVLEIECDYCGKAYRIAPEKLRGMLDTN